MKNRLLLGLALSLLFVFTLYPPFADAALYDNFKKANIDPKKWNSWEFVREIQDGKLVSKVTAYGYTVFNGLNFKDPDNINYIEADVTLNQIEEEYDQNDPNKYSFPCARLIGYFYNDGTASGPGSLKGEALSLIRIMKYRGVISAQWGVWKLKDDAGNNQVVMTSDVFPIAISLGKTYKLSILFEPNLKRFTFAVGSTTQTWISPDTIYPSNIPWKAIGPVVWISPPGSSFSGKISASFDNVIAKDESGNIIVTDDFSSPTIDPNKWDSYEIVREVLDGKLWSQLRSVDQNSWNRLVFKNPEQVKDIQAKVTLFDFQNPDGANTRARLGGHFYNDTGDPESGYEGDVWAEVSIGGEGTTPTTNWSIVRYDNKEGTALSILDYGTLPIPINLGETYDLLLDWDGLALTFKCNGIGTNYIPTTNKFPPNNKHKELATRIFPPISGLPFEAFISATFDEVMINETGIPIDGTWLFDISGADKGGAAIECFGNEMKGSGITQGLGQFTMIGNYTIDIKGVINGTFTAEGELDTVTGTFTGKVDKKTTKVTLKIADGPSWKGVRLPEDPEIPSDWTAKISGGGIKGVFDEFFIAPEPYDEVIYSRIFTFSGAGQTDAEDPIDISGIFFLASKNTAYGIYEISGAIAETGVFSGKITLPSGKFSFKTLSETGVKHTLSGLVIP